MSFSDIVRMYQAPLYWYIRRTVIVHENAEDILQETFIKAYRHLWMLRSPDSLRPWLYRIATNEMNRFFRKNRIELQSMELPFAEPVERDAPSPSEVAKVISTALLKMSPLQRQVFNLKYYEDMDYDRISAITGKSKNNLMVSYHEARNKILKEIENE